MDKLRMQSADGVQDNIQKIAQLFPNCVTETVVGYHDDGSSIIKRKVDFEKLQQELSDAVISGREERYQFTWPDKRKAILAANAPVNATLRPCREESVDFDTTQNLYIEGDNLDVLKCLKETYLHKVKMIYIDPPYNTGNDFVYEDDFAESASDYASRSGQFDEQGNRMVTNTESNGRFHTDWLNMIYPRLKVARDLLSDDGVIFISIDDNEVENLKKVCNEIFGEGNFVAMIVWQKKYAATNDSKGFSTTHDYILSIQKSSSFSRNLLPRTQEQNKPYKNDDQDGKGLWRSDNLLVKSFSPSGVYPIKNPNTGVEYFPPQGSCWRASKETMSIWLKENRIYFGKDGLGAPQLKRYLNEVQPGRVPVTWWTFEEVGHNDEANKEVSALFERKTPFDTPKPVRLIKQLLRIGSNSDSLILDFFSGSATTAHAVMQLNAEDGGNRKFIMVQLPELTDEKSEAYKAGYKTICEIGKERIRRAGKKIKEELGKRNEKLGMFANDDSSSLIPNSTIDTGFRVLKLDSTNMRDVYYSPKDTDQLGLFNMVDNVKPDRTSEDLLFQVMLELGAELSSSIRKEELGMRNDGKPYNIYNVADGYLVACFDQDVTDEVVTAIAKMQPMYAVLRDTSMATDSTATNFEQIFKTHAPNTVTKIL